MTHADPHPSTIKCARALEMGNSLSVCIRGVQAAGTNWLSNPLNRRIVSTTIDSGSACSQLTTGASQPLSRRPMPAKSLSVSVECDVLRRHPLDGDQPRRDPLDLNSHGKWRYRLYEIHCDAFGADRRYGDPSYCEGCNLVDTPRIAHVLLSRMTAVNILLQSSGLPGSDASQV